MTYFICSTLIFFLLKKKLGVINSLVIVLINIIPLYIFYNFEFISFKDDSGEYYRNTLTLYNFYNFDELILYFFGLSDLDNQLPIDKENLFSKIYIFFYIIFFLFGPNPYSLAIFNLILKCIAFIYIINFLKKHINTTYSKEYFLAYFLLLDPWTIYYQTFFFLKEGMIMFVTIINLITFYKINTVFKIKYIIYLIITLIILFFFRYYLVFILITFYYLYFLIGLNKLKTNFKDNQFYYIISFTFIIIIMSFFIDFSEVLNVIKIENFNSLGPLKYLFSPIFINIIIHEEFSFRLLCSVIGNIFSILFIYTIFYYDFKNKLINFLLLFIGVVLISQFFALDEILTGGRHRSFIYWSMVIIVSLNLNYEKKKNKKR